MKRIHYQVMGFSYEYDPEAEKEVQKETLSAVNIPYSAENEKRAKDWHEMRMFYDEKISVLTTKREEAISSLLFSPSQGAFFH